MPPGMQRRHSPESHRYRNRHRSRVCFWPRRFYKRAGTPLHRAVWGKPRAYQGNNSKRTPAGKQSRARGASWGAEHSQLARAITILKARPHALPPDAMKPAAQPSSEPKPRSERTVVAFDLSTSLPMRPPERLGAPISLPKRPPEHKTPPDFTSEATSRG